MGELIATRHIGYGGYRRIEKDSDGKNDDAHQE
jgi:hypothetical protein